MALQARDSVPECTVWEAATTGGVPAKCSLQPTIPCAPMQCFHMHLAGAETAELPAQNGLGGVQNQRGLSDQSLGMILF